MTTDYSYHANKFEFCSLMSFLVTFNCFLYEIIVESQGMVRNNTEICHVSLTAFPISNTLQNYSLISQLGHNIIKIKNSSISIRRCCPFVAKGVYCSM